MRARQSAAQGVQREVALGKQVDSLVKLRKKHATNLPPDWENILTKRGPSPSPGNVSGNAGPDLRNGED